MTAPIEKMHSLHRCCASWMPARRRPMRRCSNRTRRATDAFVQAASRVARLERSEGRADASGRASPTWWSTETTPFVPQSGPPEVSDHAHPDDLAWLPFRCVPWPHWLRRLPSFSSPWSSGQPIRSVARCRSRRCSKIFAAQRLCSSRLKRWPFGRSVGPRRAWCDGKIRRGNIASPPARGCGRSTKRPTPWHRVIRPGS